MKIVCTSDTHGFHDSITHYPSGDVFIHAGDFGVGIREINQWIKKLKSMYRYVIFIAGNHDHCALEEYPNTIYLEDSEIVLEGIKFYGSPYHPKIGNFPFGLERGSLALKDKWGRIPDDTNVLITHGPAYGIGDRTINNQLVGCELMAARIKQLSRLKAHVFGHIHEGYGMYQVNDTLHVNVSAMDASFQPRNNPLVELEV